MMKTKIAQFEGTPRVITEATDWLSDKKTWKHYRC